MNDAKTRLDSITEKLKERGVVDVKFAWNGTVNFTDPSKPILQLSAESTLDSITNDISDVLEAYLNGETKPFNGIGDRQRA
jgi:hypothetical protein